MIFTGRGVKKSPCTFVSGFLGVDLRRLPSVLSGSAFVQALKNTRSKLQAVDDLERERK